MPENMRFSARDTVLTAMMTALMAVCSWISIPSAVPFTLQTFAVFSALLLVGGRRSLLAVTAYLLAGAVGIPVFSGFSGGIGVILGANGGYMAGFIFMALIYWCAEKLPFRKNPVRIAAIIVGTAVMYVTGTAWFILIYTGRTGAITLFQALEWCVLPFIIPDMIKLILALAITERLRRHIRI